MFLFFHFLSNFLQFLFLLSYILFRFFKLFPFPSSVAFDSFAYSFLWIFLLFFFLLLSKPVVFLFNLTDLHWVFIFYFCTILSFGNAFFHLLSFSLAFLIFLSGFHILFFFFNYLTFYTAWLLVLAFPTPFLLFLFFSF